MTRAALVIFDVGGTVIYDSADVAAVLVSALEQHRISISPSKLHEWRGASKREVIERLVKTGTSGRPDPLAVYLTFQNLLLDALTARGIEAIPGVEAALASLREHQVHVVLATGFDTRVVGVVLEHLGLGKIIDGVVTSDDVVRGRPDPDLIFAAMDRVGVTDANAVVNVGDTVNDLRAAAAAGVGASIGVLTGAHDQAQLETVPHTAILPSAADVPQWLANRQWTAA